MPSDLGRQRLFRAGQTADCRKRLVDAVQLTRSELHPRTISRVVTGIAVPLLFGLPATDVSVRMLVVYLALFVLTLLWFEQR
jgi:hypothetical protein